MSKVSFVLPYREGKLLVVSANGEMYFYHRDKFFLEECGPGPVREIENRLLSALEGYHCDDDVTWVIVKKL